MQGGISHEQGQQDDGISGSAEGGHTALQQRKCQQQQAALQGIAQRYRMPHTADGNIDERQQQYRYCVPALAGRRVADRQETTHEYLIHGKQ